MWALTIFLHKNRASWGVAKYDFDWAFCLFMNNNNKPHLYTQVWFPMHWCTKYMWLTVWITKLNMFVGIDCCLFSILRHNNNIQLVSWVKSFLVYDTLLYPGMQRFYWLQTNYHITLYMATGLSEFTASVFNLMHMNPSQWFCLHFALLL